MKADDKKLTWENMKGYLNLVITVDKLPDFAKDLYFVKKAQRAKDWYDKHGWPEDEE